MYIVVCGLGSTSEKEAQVVRNGAITFLHFHLAVEVSNIEKTVWESITGRPKACNENVECVRESFLTSSRSNYGKGHAKKHLKLPHWNGKSFYRRFPKQIIAIFIQYCNSTSPVVFAWCKIAMIKKTDKYYFLFIIVQIVHGQLNY